MNFLYSINNNKVKKAVVLRHDLKNVFVKQIGIIDCNKKLNEFKNRSIGKCNL